MTISLVKLRNRIQDVVSRIEFPGFNIGVYLGAGHVYLQVDCDDYDNRTGDALHWKGRKWLLSEHMGDGEIVQTAWLAVLTALEHEAREVFTYRGQSIFDPHFNIEKLVELRSQPESIKERDHV